MLARMPMIPTTIISSTRVKPRGWRSLRMQAFWLATQPRGNISGAGHSRLLFPSREQVGWQDGVVAELFRDGIEAPVEAVALVAVRVEEPELRWNCTEVARVHAGESDGVRIDLTEEAEGHLVDLGGVVGRERQRLLPRHDPEVGVLHLEMHGARLHARAPQPGADAQRLLVDEGVQVFPGEIVLESLLRADALRVEVRLHLARVDAVREIVQPGSGRPQLRL